MTVSSIKIFAHIFIDEEVQTVDDRSLLCSLFVYSNYANTIKSETQGISLTTSLLGDTITISYWTVI